MEKEHVSIQEAMERLDISRATLYSYLGDLGIRSRKFPHSNRHFITAQDLARVEEAKAQPWKFAEARAQREAGGESRDGPALLMETPFMAR